MKRRAMVCRIATIVVAWWIAGAAHAQASPLSACPDGLVGVQTEGFASIIGDAGAARDEARRDALRTAVEQVVGVAIESNTLVLNYALVEDSVRTRSQGYVASHTVIASETSGSMITVTVDACVDPNALRTDLEGFGMVLREQLGNPRLVVYAEGGDDAAALVARRLLESHFGGLGFDVRRAGNSTCDDGDEQPTADIVICANVQTEANELSLRQDLFTARASVALEAVLASTGQVLVRVLSQTATHVSFNPAAGVEQALDRAMAPILDLFTMRLISELNDEASIASLELVINGLPSFTSYTTVESLLRDMRGVRLVESRGFSEGTGSFTIQGSASAIDLARRLAASEEPRIRVTHVYMHRIEADVVP